MTLRAAAEQALDTLEHVQAHIGRYDPPVVTTIARAMQPTIDALRAALAAEQPQPKVQPAVGVQACRPEDRAMLSTPAGAELLTKVAMALTVPQAVATAPKRIWLQVSDDRADMDEPFPGDGATWCADSVVDAEVEYVRADLAPPPSTPCPHTRSSGVGEWATHWCSLNGPPAVPEPSRTLTQDERDVFDAAERRRLAEEAAARQREAAEQAAAAERARAEGDAQAAELARAAAQRAQSEAAVAATTAQLVTAAPVVAEAPAKTKGIATVATIQFEVVDLHALVKHVAERPELLALLTPDSVKLRAYVRGLGTACALPGVRVFEEKTMRARAA